MKVDENISQEDQESSCTPNYNFLTNYTHSFRSCGKHDGHIQYTKCRIHLYIEICPA